MPPLLILFALVNLVVGSSAFVMAGIVEAVAANLQVPVAGAGQAMSVYALSTAFLAPLLLALTARWPRRRALVTALGLFTLGGAVCSLAGSLPMLLAGRVLMGIGAAFTPMAAGIAVALVEPARRGRALSLVFVGMSLSYVVGVPLGAWLGLNHGWHAPVMLGTACSAVATALVAWQVPARLDAPGGSFEGLRALLERPAVLGVLGMTLAYFTAIFLVFSYIGPVLQSLVPMPPAQLSLTLSLFGLAGVVGTVTGGLANDRHGPRRTLTVQLALLGSMMALLPFTAGHWPLLVVVMLTWGVAGFGMMAPQQSRLAAMAPSQAPLLLSLNTSMLYLGTALGAAIGGPASALLGFDHLAWAGVPFAAAAMLLLRRVGAAAPASTLTRA